MKRYVKAIKNSILLIILVFFIKINSSNCQTNKHLSIGIGPLSYFDPITPSLNIHLEAKVFSHYSLDVAYGIDLSEIALLRWHPNSEFQHHEFKLGLKRLFLSSNDLYGGIEYFSVLNNYEKSSGQYINDGERLIFDSASVSRNIHGLRFKLGSQLIKKSFGIDFYLGAGIRNLNNLYDPVNERSADDLWEDSEWFAPIDQTSGARLKLDLNMGFKIFYMILK